MYVVAGNITEQGAINGIRGLRMCSCIFCCSAGKLRVPVACAACQKSGDIKCIIGHYQYYEGHGNKQLNTEVRE